MHKIDGICPICQFKIKSPKNVWVKYHISYKPELTILACRYCNWTEYNLRNNIKIPTTHFRRTEKLLKFHNKIGYPI